MTGVKLIMGIAVLNLIFLFTELSFNIIGVPLL